MKKDPTSPFPTSRSDRRAKPINQALPATVKWFESLAPEVQPNALMTAEGERKREREVRPGVRAAADSAGQEVPDAVELGQRA